MKEREPYKRAGRCVHCGKRGVVPGEACQYSRSGHGTMDLPAGKTCGDCVHMSRCGLIYGHIHQDEVCDFHPMRFREKASQP